LSGEALRDLDKAFANVFRRVQEKKAGRNVKAFILSWTDLRTVLESETDIFGSISILGIDKT
jgi:uncharacterized protein